MLSAVFHVEQVDFHGSKQCRAIHFLPRFTNLGCLPSPAYGFAAHG